jgi:hypothetical protein
MMEARKRSCNEEYKFAHKFLNEEFKKGICNMN